MTSTDSVALAVIDFHLEHWVCLVVTLLAPCLLFYAFQSCLHVWLTCLALELFITFSWDCLVLCSTVNPVNMYSRDTEKHLDYPEMGFILCATNSVCSICIYNIRIKHTMLSVLFFVYIRSTYAYSETKTLCSCIMADCLAANDSTVMLLVW